MARPMSLTCRTNRTSCPTRRMARPMSLTCRTKQQYEKVETIPRTLPLRLPHLISLGSGNWPDPCEVGFEPQHRVAVLPTPRVAHLESIPPFTYCSNRIVDSLIMSRDPTCNRQNIIPPVLPGVEVTDLPSFLRVSYTACALSNALRALPLRRLQVPRLQTIPKRSVRDEVLTAHETGRVGAPGLEVKPGDWRGLSFKQATKV